MADVLGFRKTIAAVATVEDVNTAEESRVEWITLGLIVAVYAGWGAALFWLAAVAPVFAVLVTGVLIAFHASLTHEVLHGHPFQSVFWNEAMMRLPLNLAIPYCRFRDLHLAHHRDASLTDPFDDPESNYLDPGDWERMGLWARVIYRVNNTLAGRMVGGPLLGQVIFMRDDWRRFRDGDKSIAAAWGMHVIGAGAVIALVLSSAMPLWAYLVSCYIGLAFLRIRTFLEHQAHERVRARTVIIEDRGPLAFLFLNNNLHVVHHMHPGVAWYDLPALYKRKRDRFQAINEGYVYRSYADVFSAYLWRTKDPVAHPLWRRK